jgi:hypothetical protein
LYNKRLEPGKEFDEDILVATVVEGSTGDLRKKLVARHNEFDTYHKMASFIREYHDCSRAFVPPNTGKKAAKKHNDPMDIDAMGKGGKGKKGGKAGKGKKGGKAEATKGKDHKGKGKQAQKGKGPSTARDKFEGYCGNCGIWGHRQAECWWSTAGGKIGKPAVHALEQAETTLATQNALYIKPDNAEYFDLASHVGEETPAHSWMMGLAKD